MTDSRRPKGILRWVGGLLAFVALVAVLGVWARRSPFEAAFRELERTSAGDPAVYFGRAIRDRNLDSFAAAARASSEPGYAAIWCSETFDTENPPAGVREAALGRWAEVDPENGVVDLLRARLAIERRDIPGAAALVDRGLDREKPACYGHFSIGVHLALQKRLGTNDPLAFVRFPHAFGPISEVRRTLVFARGVAEQAAWEGRLEEAEARARSRRSSDSSPSRPRPRRPPPRSRPSSSAPATRRPPRSSGRSSRRSCTTTPPARPRRPRCSGMRAS